MAYNLGNSMERNGFSFFHFDKVLTLKTRLSSPLWERTMGKQSASCDIPLGTSKSLDLESWKVVDFKRRTTQH